MLVELVCRWCIRTFQTEKKDAHKRKYCSHSCAGKAQMRPTSLVTLFCQVCQKPFDVNPSQTRSKYFDGTKNRDTAKFCSRDCFHTYERSTVPPRQLYALRPAVEPKPHRPPIELKCLSCSKTFLVRACIANRRKYCSKSCARHAQVMLQYRTELKCLHCETPFVVSMSQSQRRKYCSRSCRAKAVGQTINKVPRDTKPRTELRTHECEMCHEEFQYRSTAECRRFCSRPCASRHLKQLNTGRPNPKSYAPRTYVTLQCGCCGGSYQKPASRAASSRYCSRSCRAQHMRVRYAGENAPNWKGGRQPYYGPNWREQQRQTRLRDTVCRDCGRPKDTKGKKLAVHHVRAFRFFGLARYIEANDLSNLICVCARCHMRREKADNPG